MLREALYLLMKNLRQRTPAMANLLVARGEGGAQARMPSLGLTSATKELNRYTGAR